MADVDKSIIDVDFLKNIGLYVDIRNSRLIDSVTMMKIKIKPTVIPLFRITTIKSDTPQTSNKPKIIIL